MPANRIDDEDPAAAEEKIGFRAHLHEFYERNFGLFLVFSAQTFGSVVRIIPIQTSAALLKRSLVSPLSAPSCLNRKKKIPYFNYACWY